MKNSGIKILAFVVLSLSTACAQTSSASLKLLLSDRHKVPTFAELEKNYSSEDALVADLLELRLVDYPPFVSLRAEGLLLQYSDREDVISNLEEDLNHSERLGLARVIIRGLDKIKNSDAKHRFSLKAAELVSTNKILKSLKEGMENSSDPVVKRAILER